MPYLFGQLLLMWSPALSEIVLPILALRAPSCLHRDKELSCKSCMQAGAPPHITVQVGQLTACSRGDFW